MANMKIECYVVGPVQTNCFFVINEDSGEMLIIDPGDNADKLAQRIESAGYRPVAVLLTHGHFDHATGAKELSDRFRIKIYAHEAEMEVLESPEKNSSWMIGETLTFFADVYVKDEQELDLAGFHIRVLHTPGHTIGGCCYYFGYENVLLAGDTLFAGSVGRTDLPTGSMSQLVRSIREKLMTLPDATEVYTGHGDATRIETERMYNPYL